MTLIILFVAGLYLLIFKKADRKTEIPLAPFFAGRYSVGSHYNRSVRRTMMKDKKNLFPILLLLLSVASVYYLVQFRYDAGATYDHYMAEARNASASGLESKAVENYLKAIEIYPSDTLYYEVGQMYISYDDYWNAKRWYENEMLADYPKSVLTYKLGIEASILREDYEEIINIYLTCQKRELVNEEIEALVDPYTDKYEITGSYAEVGAFSNAVRSAPVSEGDSKWKYIDPDGGNTASGKL